MDLTELQFHGLSRLEYRIFSTPLSLEPLSRVLVIEFAGEYGAGSGGNGDARFMVAVVHGALAAWQPSGLVLDLRSLRYTFSDSILAVLDPDRLGRWQRPLPLGIVVSDQNRAGLTSLFRELLRKEPHEWLFASPEEALEAVRVRHAAPHS